MSDQWIEELPDYFKQKATDDKLEELAMLFLNGPISFKDFITYRGLMFSIICELLAYRDKGELNE